MKSLERKNEDLRDEIAIRDETIEQLQSNIKRMEVEHSRATMNKDNEHRKALEAKEAEHKEETNILNSTINPTTYSTKEGQKNEDIKMLTRVSQNEASVWATISLMRNGSH